MENETIGTLEEKEIWLELKRLKISAGNLVFHHGIVWNIEQLNDVIKENNSHNEMIKMELRIEKGEWRYEIYKYPSIF